MNRPIRVLELRSADRSGGGPDKTILLGASLADRSRFEVIVCYVRDMRDTTYDIDRRAAALDIDYVEVHERHSFDYSIWPALRRLVVERGIDIVHAHEYKTDLLALLLARADGVTPLATVHGWTGHSWREEHIYYPIDKRLLSRFPRLIAVSEDIRQTLIRHGAAPGQVSTLLNGIDPDVFIRDESRDVQARRALGIPAETIAIGAVGRLAPQKRFDLVIDAVARLRERGRNVVLLIAGGGDLRPALEAQARRLGLGEHCRLLGHTNDVIALHHALDLLVQASDYEGTPNAVLEAMAMRTPIVATAAGGTGQLIVDGIHGRLVPIGDKDALIDAIDQAVSDRVAARQWAAQARARVEAELSFERRTRTMEDIYEELFAANEQSRVRLENSPA
jgi:glycosyltransferase involved in cell wall biosynthesis